MKRILLLCAVACAIAALLLINGRRKAPVGVSFPEPPIELSSN